MRINEEIDVLEVMGIRSIAYLASTRVIGGVIVVIPLFCVAVLMSFLAARFGATVAYRQSTGVYDHYFNTLLNPVDLLWAFFAAIAMSVAIMLVHTYYGFNASGGPACMGEAVGRSVRTSFRAEQSRPGSGLPVKGATAGSLRDVGSVEMPNSRMGCVQRDWAARRLTEVTPPMKHALGRVRTRGRDRRRAARRVRPVWVAPR
jgi:hypothetical protein